ncbi:hypothetical protein [Companilactobacillus mishanensis]|uniref:DUF2178 domain-containing protein n=1 Tax=Companilactobacillus mishanensis TaxID=2486008 RepID=A0ABW9P6Y7_9LACO|nr:hypothetical protein [Companilactobacillus mishanensis]MQS45036.1 hypothetical protein [Companilactobacillus mishanensis]
MSSTRKYLIGRATMISLLAVLVGIWGIASYFGKGEIAPFLAIELALVVVGNRQNKKYGKGNFLKINHEGYSEGMQHNDEREARNLLNATFISARITLLFVMLCLTFACIYIQNFGNNAKLIFDIRAFAFLGVFTIIIQQWSLVITYLRFDK